MTGALVTAGLITSALLLTLVAPRVLAAWSLPRTDPGPALLLWQTTSLSGVVCALAAAPVAALTLDPGRRPMLLAAAWVLTLAMAVRLLWSGHRVGTDLRRRRERQRELLDLVGERLEGADEGHDPVTVLAHASPTAFCLPGREDRIVLSRATVDRLGAEELRAVLAHEQTHLDHRHDLLLELFTVLHEAVPAAARAPGALREVHLLTEALADKGAVRRSGAPALARALVAMATPADARSSAGHTRSAHLQGDPTPAPDGLPHRQVAEPALTGSGTPSQVRTRVGLLAAGGRPGWLRPGLLGASLATALLPLGLLVTLGL